MDDSFKFEPLQELLDVAKVNNPNVLILMGPFVDVNHPLLNSGTCDFYVDDLFKQEISTRLNDFAQTSPNTKVILIPSVRDICCDFVKFPQPPFLSDFSKAKVLKRKEELGLSDKLILFPNPVTFSVNEIVFGVSSADCIVHLGSKEFSKINSKDVKEPRIPSLYRYLLEQQSFYPSFPPNTGDAVDISCLDELEMKITPGII